MWKAPGRFTEAAVSRELFDIDAHLQECNHSDGEAMFNSECSELAEELELSDECIEELVIPRLIPNY